MSDTPLKPVTVSVGAKSALLSRFAQWSGWRDAKMVLGPSPVSPWADVEFPTHTVTLNIDSLLLNPNRVLNTLTPFRLRQEAIVTGTLIHEAGHARYSRWMPRNEAEAKAFAHGDGTKPTMPVVDFARMMEEARVEGHMAANSKTNQTDGLEWTLRATVAYLLPFSDLSGRKDEVLMKFLTSWGLRAGRATAINHWTGWVLPQWAHDFNSLLHKRVYAHLLSHRGLTEDDVLFGIADDQGATDQTREVMALLRSMVICEDHDGSTMIDLAKRVLSILFPETDPDDMPSPETGCSAGMPDESDDDESDGSDDEDGDADGDDEGSGRDEDDAEAEGSGDDEGSDADDSGDGSDDDGADGSGDDADGDSDDVDGEGASPSTEAGDGDSDSDEESEAAAAALREIEEASNREARAEQAEQSAQAPSPAEGMALGASDGPSDSSGNGGWRNPGKDERASQVSAGRMLRDLIDPAESSKVMLTETPAANVDGAAMAAWRAAGARQDPRFFVRHKRQTLPSPPVQIAVLVDISASMDVLQKPSALLSWALSAAALDLRNFAGRGTQVESTLIHWGSKAEVIQPNGSPLPGIREVDCRQGTTVMGDALRLVEEQIPGFFDVPTTPVNRLLVQFTDWQLAPWCRTEVTPMIQTALRNGVRMLSVVPFTYHNDLDTMMHGFSHAHMSHQITYDPKSPDVWPQAARLLN